MQHRIVVLGAGYAGAIAAGRLAKRLHRDDVDDHPRQRRARLRRAGPHAPARDRPGPQAPAAARDVRGHRRDAAASRGSPRVDVDRRTVAVTDADGADELGYDTLVYALGSGWNDHGVPGAAEHAHEIASRPGALRLRERLAAPRRRADAWSSSAAA